VPTLLLADDSVTIQRVIELTFADEDIQVVAVSDGDAAIAQLNANPPDIVLADIGMPGKSGYEVAQYIKQSPRLQHIPIVLLTGAFEPVDQERANDAGCDGILQKPFEPQQVVGRVRELLAKASKGGAPAPAARPPAADMFAPAAATIPTGPAAPATNDYFDKLDAAFATLTNAPAPAAPQLSKLSSELPSVAPPAAASGEIDWFASQLNPPAASTAAAEPWDLPGPAAAASVPDDLPLTRVDEPSVADDLNIIDNGAEVLEAGAEVRGAEVLGAVPGAVVLGAPHAAPQHVAPHAAPQHQAPQHPVVHPAPQHPAQHPAPSTQHQAPQHPVAPVALPSLPDAFAALLAAEANDSRPAPASWPTAGAAAPSAPPVDIEDLVDRVTRRVIDRLGDAVIKEAVADATSLIAERLVIEEIERIKSSIK
jgi:CheY-like chemotaxis protein